MLGEHAALWVVVHEVRRVTLSSIIRGEQVEGLASEPVEDSDFGLRVSQHQTCGPQTFSSFSICPCPQTLKYGMETPTPDPKED